MTSNQARVLALSIGCLLALGGSDFARAGQPLETESTRLMSRGAFQIAGGFERQTSSSGTEAAVPFALEYGITDRLEATVEPVFYSDIRDRGAHPQKGPGDVEATLTGLLSPERAGWPSLALAAEVKVPTARNNRIGTGKTDVSAYLIASKRHGLWDTHANAGYTLIGRPRGAQTSNVASFALAEELHFSPRVEFVGEVFGSTAAAKEGGEGAITAGESVLTPELSSGELVGGVGLRYHPTRSLTYSLGLSLDNQRALLVHPGIAFEW